MLSGTVVGYVASSGMVEGAVGAQGLSVRIDTDGGGEPEVMHWYPLHTLPDCSNGAWATDELTEQFPLASRVTVVGHAISEAGGKARIIATNSDDFGHIAHVSDGAIGAAGAFEFRGPTRSADPSVRAVDNADVWGAAHRQWREDFEFYRALTVIPSRDEADRTRILRQVAAFYQFGVWSPQKARKQYDALLSWAKLSPSSRRQLIRHFEGIWKAR